MNMLKKFVKDEAGLETVEYAIITGLIVAGTVGLIIWVGQWVNGVFTDLQTELSSAGTGG